jgi:RNA polymerase sigma-70 factor (sigma-E family)
VLATRLRSMRPQSKQTMTAGVEGIRLEPGLGPLARLYEEHSARAFRLAYLLTGDRDLAEDLVQDAFVKLIGRFADLRSPESFDVYLKRTVVTLSYGLFRRRRTERAYLARKRGLAERTSDVLPDFERRDELWAQLQRIAPRQRAALVLRYYEDLSEQQAADVLGCSLRTVKSLVRRGIQAMRDQLGGES